MISRNNVVFEKLRSIFFLPHENVKTAFSNSSGLKRVIEINFCDELLWTVGPTVEIKLRFQIFLALCGHFLISCRPRT